MREIKLTKKEASLTKREEILTFIKEYVSLRQYPPTIREIGDAVNLKSSSSVHSHLNKLEKEGKLEIERNKPRAIRVL
ncbi:hypothetical protein H9X78_16160 [Clostridium saudiense]|nr:hypothetical protein [Clostridium saudiense]